MDKVSGSLALASARCTNKTGKGQRVVLLNGNEPIRLPEMVGEGD